MFVILVIVSVDAIFSLLYLCLVRSEPLDTQVLDLI